MKILVSVDGSPYTKRMLAYLTAHDEWLGARHRYTVVHAVAAVLDKALLGSHYDEEAEKVFKSIRVFFAEQHIDAAFVAQVGPAAEVVSRLATEGGFDLLMMGSHGHGALSSLVMGSVAARVLASCRTPVLLVR